MKTLNYLSLLLLSCITIACGLYSFNGASISNETKTVSVEYFPNKASNVEPTLSQVFTEKLKDYFVEQTNLILTAKEGDLSFSGEISKYEIKPISINSEQTAEKNRLSISVKVDFVNRHDETKNFNQNFSRYRDYESSENLSEIEENLIQEITNELAEDIFNKAVVNW